MNRINCIESFVSGLPPYLKKEWEQNGDFKKRCEDFFKPYQDLFDLMQEKTIVVKNEGFRRSR